MEASDFVKKEIDKLIKKFPYIKCYYEFDEFDNTHYVKIEPEKYAETIENYLINEDIDDKFIDNFPFHGLVFTTNDNIINKDNIQYEKTGKYYKKEFTENLQITISFITEQKNLQKISNITTKKINPDPIPLSNDVIDLNSEETTHSISFAA